MSITDNYQRLPCSSIVILRDERQRRHIVSDSLLDSIKQHGVLQPIIVRPSELRSTDDGVGQVPILVAGERRLQASIDLDLPDIPVRWTSDLTQLEAQIIELEENLRRKDLCWQDQVKAIQRIHALYSAKTEGWQQIETAEALNLTPGWVNLVLIVGRALEEPRIAEAATIREAYNVLRRREARASGDALEELVGLPMLSPVLEQAIPLPFVDTLSNHSSVSSNSAQTRLPVETAPSLTAPIVAPVLHANFLEWAPSYNGEKFNLIHCDFPYGRDEFAGAQGKGAEIAIYDSDSETYFTLLEVFCKELDRFCSLSAHLMFWCSAEVLNPRTDYSKRTWAAFSEFAPSWDFTSPPLIWHKTDNAGIAPDARRSPRHIYEVCLLASRGRRQLARVMGDLYGSPTNRQLHPSTKPEPMLRHFMTMLVDSNTRMLDPTAGSGAALRAADSLGADKVVGLEVDGEFVRIANQAFRARRALAMAAN